MSKAEDWLKNRMDDHNTRRLLDQLDPIYQGELIGLLQLYADEQSREAAIKFGEWMVLISKSSAEKYYDEWKSNQEDKG